MIGSKGKRNLDISVKYIIVSMATYTAFTMFVLSVCILAVVGCGGGSSPIPDIDATIEAKVQDKLAVEATVEARVKDRLAKAIMTPTPASPLAILERSLVAVGEAGNYHVKMDDHSWQDGLL